MRLRGLLAALSACLCLVPTAWPAAVQAQSRTRETQFDIPGGDMKAALDAFGRQAGVPIIYQGGEVAGLRTPGYRGRALPRVALAALLRGTGLRIHVDSSGAMAVARVRVERLPVEQQWDRGKSWLKPRVTEEETVAREIVVTGTRVVRGGYDAPTPTTVLVRELIEGKAPVTAIDALVTLPVFRNSSTPGTAGVAQAGPSGQSFVNLRGLGMTRTLVLLDGQRFVPSTSVGTVDIGVIPGALVQRVDIVTGGASAAYGSDAVAGVVNFVLDNRLTGLKGAIEGGVSQYGDNRTFRVELSAGTGIADRGHFVLSGEYVQASGVPLNARPDTEYPVARLIINQDWTPDNGQMRRLIVPYVYTKTASLGGVVIGGPLAGLEFGPGGTTSQQPTGTFNGTSSHVLPGRFDDQAWDLSVSLSSLPQEKAALYAHASWDVAQDLSFYTTGLIARNSPGPFYSSPANTIISGSFIVRRDNVLLPDAVRSRMEELGLETISVGRYSEDFGASVVSRTNDTFRAVGGIRGDIGGGWNIDAYGQYGENRQTFLIERNWIRSNIALASDAVDEGLASGGAANGNIVCRSTLTDPGNGCIPLNIFGPFGTRFDPVTPPSANYIFGTTRAVLNTAQTVAALSVSGDPLRTWAGPISFVAGAEFRRESARQVVDALSAASAFGLGNPKPLSGDVDMKEAFVETVVPLARDRPLLHRLDISGAVRVTDYSISGLVATWKLGINWQPIESVRLRITQSRDIRAPNILELFSSPVMSTGGAVDPFTNTSPTFQVSSLGNPDLLPEKADAKTTGVVVRPAVVPGLEFSADYYKINVLQAISTLSPADIVSRCYLGNTGLCGLITRVGGVITQIDNPYLNLQSLSTDGFDFELGYRRAIGRGTGFARVLANIAMSYVVSDGVTRIERAGDMSNGQPRTALNAMFGYRIDDFSVVADVTRIGGGNYDNTFTAPTDINDNTIPSRTYLGLQASVDLGDDARRRELFFNISNVFNARPPPVFVFSGGPGYERVGRSFRAGLRFAI